MCNKLHCNTYGKKEKNCRSSGNVIHKQFNPSTSHTTRPAKNLNQAQCDSSLPPSNFVVGGGYQRNELKCCLDRSILLTKLHPIYMYAIYSM